SSNSLSRRDLAEFFVGLPPGGTHHRFDEFFSWWHNGQAVGPATVKKKLNRSVVIRDINRFGVKTHENPPASLLISTHAGVRESRVWGVTYDSPRSLSGGWFVP